MINKKILFYALFSYFVFIPNLKAHAWIELKIPGAICGDAKEYKIFYSPGNPKKISLELMGGGVCWNEKTCWGPTMLTWIHPIPALPNFSYISSSKGPVSDYTQIYLPYCTGDVWSGEHTASYSGKKKTYHHGKINFNKTIDHLEKTNIINFKEAQSFLLYGSSAGAIGALLNIKKIEEKINPKAKKLLIADSPGLHWNKDFWNIFSTNQIKDIAKSLNESNLHLDLDSGNIAKQLSAYCDNYQDWKFSFIQSTKDIIMAKIFGKMDLEEHQKNVLGDEGIKETLRHTSNCFTLIPEDKGHAYLLLKKYSSQIKDMETTETIKNFADRTITNYLE